MRGIIENKKEAIIFFLAAFGLSIRINFIGSISLTEIFVLTQIPVLWKWIKKFQFPEFNKFCYLFAMLIASQILISFLQNATGQDTLKSIMLSLETLLITLFFAKKLIYTPQLIILIPIANILSLIIIGDQFGFANDGETTYFKFYVAPMIANIACIVILQTKYKWFTNKSAFVFIFAGFFCIIGGARSMGFSLLFTAIVCLVVKSNIKLSIKKIWPQIIIFAVIFQLFYATVYIPKVQSGEWGSNQNREQLEKINYSKNIFMMLLAARSDFFVSWMAFTDKPLLGHGYMAKDYTHKYAMAQAALLKTNYVTKEDIKLVPAHSVLLGYGVYHGILSLLLFSIIFYYVYKLGIKSLRFNHNYRAYLSYILIISAQHILFGPPAVLKNYNAILWAVILMFYFRTKRYEIQINSRNCNLSKESG